MKKDKVLKSDFNEGTYGRSREMVYAIYYTHCLPFTRRAAITRNISEMAFLNDDKRLMENAVGCPLSELENYERDKEWEALSLQKKKARIAEGNAPTYARYGREIVELLHWNGNEDSIFYDDLVSPYSYTPCEGKDLLFEVTSKKKLIGKHISRSLYCFSRGIILYQYLFQGLAINHALLLKALSRDREDVLMNAFLLHCCKAKGLTSYGKLMREASICGLIRTIDHMVTCGTLPNTKMQDEVAVQLTIMSLNKTAITEEDVDPIDLPRYVRYKLANLASKYIGAEAATNIRSKAVVVHNSVTRVRIAAAEEATPSLTDAAASQLDTRSAAPSTTDKDVVTLPDATDFLDI